MSDVAGAVVIVDGSVASLVAAWREMLRVTSGLAQGGLGQAGLAQGGGVFGGMGQGGGSERGGSERSVIAQYLIGFVPMGLSEGQRASAMRVIELTGMSRAIGGGGVGVAGSGERGPDVRAALRGLDATEMLLGAGALAMERGVERVVWPVCLGTLAAGHMTRTGEDWGAKRAEVMTEIFDRCLLTGRLLSIDVGAGKRAIAIQTPLLELTDEQLVDLAADLDAPAGRAWWRQEDHAAWRGLLGASGLLIEPATEGAGRATGQWIEGKSAAMVAERGS